MYVAEKFYWPTSRALNVIDTLQVIYRSYMRHLEVWMQHSISKTAYFWKGKRRQTFLKKDSESNSRQVKSHNLTWLSSAATWLDYDLKVFLLNFCLTWSLHDLTFTLLNLVLMTWLWVTLTFWWLGIAILWNCNDLTRLSCFHDLTWPTQSLFS